MAAIDVTKLLDGYKSSVDNGPVAPDTASPRPTRPPPVADSSRPGSPGFRDTLSRTVQGKAPRHVKLERDVTETGSAEVAPPDTDIAEVDTALAAEVAESSPSDAADPVDEQTFPGELEAELDARNDSSPVTIPFVAPNAEIPAAAAPQVEPLEFVPAPDVHQSASPCAGIEGTSPLSQQDVDNEAPRSTEFVEATFDEPRAVPQTGRAPLEVLDHLQSAPNPPEPAPALTFATNRSSTATRLPAREPELLPAAPALHQAAAPYSAVTLDDSIAATSLNGQPALPPGIAIPLEIEHPTVAVDVRAAELEALGQIFDTSPPDAPPTDSIDAPLAAPSVLDELFGTTASARSFLPPTAFDGRAQDDDAEGDAGTAHLTDRGQWEAAGSATSNARTPRVAVEPPVKLHGPPLAQVDVRHVLGQVVRGIEFAGNSDSQSVQVRLDPPGLGHLQIDVSLAQGTITARLEAESSATHSLLTQNLSQLRDALTAQGVALDRLVVERRSDGSAGPVEGSFDKAGQHLGGQQPGQDQSPQQWFRQTENEDIPAAARRTHFRQRTGRLDMQV